MTLVLRAPCAYFCRHRLAGRLTLGRASSSSRLQVAESRRSKHMGCSQLAARALAAESAAPNPEGRGEPLPGPTSGSEPGKKLTAWQRVKNFFLADRIDRKRLASLGMGAVASYGFVSNATYGTGMAVSWVAFVRQSGKSPLMPGQWKPFLAFYAGAPPWWSIGCATAPWYIVCLCSGSEANAAFVNILSVASRFSWNLKQLSVGIFRFLDTTAFSAALALQPCLGLGSRF